MTAHHDVGPAGGTGTAARTRARMTYGGNATTLLELGPFTLLTDPNFLRRGQYAYLGKGLFSKRLREPALAPEDLPPLDGVLLSHLHGDHFDRVARRSLEHRLPVLTTPRAASRLAHRGFGAADGLRTWETRTWRRGAYRLDVTAVPGRHGPAGVRLAMPPVMGSVLDLVRDDRRVLRMYISGDTLCYPALAEIGERCPDIDVAVLHLGGTRAFGVLVTMDHLQGTELLSLLRPSAAVPIHYDDYGVMRDPLTAFLDLARHAGVCPVVTAPRGGTVDLAAGLPVLAAAR